MSRFPYMSRIFSRISKHVRIVSNACCYFSILGQPWLASIRSSRRGRPKTATEGSLLPRAAPLLLPHARRWETLAAAAALLLPRICSRWEGLTTAALLLLPHVRRRLHQTTQWRYGWWLLLVLLLRHAWKTLRHPTTPPQTPQATTTNVTTSKR
jgi:hypothetical protein